MSASENGIRHSVAPHDGEPGVRRSLCDAQMDSALFALPTAGMAAVIGVVALLVAFPAAAQQADNLIPASGGAPTLPKDKLPDPLSAGWRGEKVCAIKEETADYRLLFCSFAPGVGHERHFHAPHFGYVLKGGAMRISDARGVREVETKAGSSWKSDGIDWHEALNIGATTAVYLIFEPKADQ